MRISWLMKLHIWIRLKWFNSHPLNFISFKFWHALVQIPSPNFEVVCSTKSNPKFFGFVVLFPPPSKLPPSPTPKLWKERHCLFVCHIVSSSPVYRRSPKNIIGILLILWLRIIPNSEFLVLTLSTRILVRYWVQDCRISWIVFLLFHWAQESKVGSQQEGIVMNLMRRGRN